MLSTGNLSPGFDSLVTSYTVRVPRTASSITLTPALSDNSATMTVNGNPAAPGSPYGPVSLVTGSNPVSITVTASDGISTKTYTILVTRLSAIEEWRQTWFGTIANTGIAADLAAPDGDGIENLLKYGLVLPPRAHDRAVLPVPQKRNYAEGTRLAMIFTRDPVRDDVVIRVQATSDFTLPWTTLATSTNGGPFSGPGLVWEIEASQGLKTVEVRDTVNISAAPRRFLRISVSR
ncbi:cadherin-like beta sandwich domain-containing protein [Luteolibacter sp. Populi]|uniref:cadherin-like beta sandwich domain-containing protein n=1 Tax=Luteolibacter sp. Populi TaxID=3230487 RepID=UPI003466C4ED